MTRDKQLFKFTLHFALLIIFTYLVVVDKIKLCSVCISMIVKHKVDCIVDLH